MAFGSNKLPALFYGVDLARPAGRALTHAFAISLPTPPRGPSLLWLVIAGIIATATSCAGLPSTRTFPGFAGYSAGLTDDRPSPL